MTDSSSHVPQIMPPQKTSRRRRVGYWVGTLTLLAALSFYAAHTCPWFMKWLGGTPSASSTTDVTELQQRVANLEKKLVDLTTRVEATAVATPAMPAPPAAQDISRVQNDVALLTTTVAELKTALAKESTQSLLAAALTFIPLREAAQSGHGFTQELAAFRNATEHQPTLHDALTKLDVFAAQGAPTLNALRESLLDHQADALHANDKAQAEHWWQRVLIEIQSLVTIRPLHGDASVDSFTTMALALAKSDAHSALEGFKTLPLPAQQNLADWKTQLETRQNLDATLQAVAAQLTSSAQATP